MRKVVLIIFSMLAFLSAPAIAAGNNADRWTVTQRSGDVRVVRPGLQPASMTVNQALVAGDAIVTGASGRATLARGADYIVVAPHSRLRLPSKPQKAGFTSIIQDLGTLLYKVRHTGVPHFSVDTPMLAAVVKGTTFTIVVQNERSAVQVIEGAVEVTAADGGMQSLVHGGKAVFIERNNPKALITADAVTLGHPTETAGEVYKISGSAGDSALNVTALTAGQVRVDAPQPVANNVVTIAKVDATVTNLPPTSDVVAAVAAPAPVVTAPAVAAPAPAVPVATVTVTPVAAPIAAAPVVTVPTVAAPTVTVPTVTAPTVTVPTVTTPTVTIPTVTAPTVTVPTVTVPTVTVPTVTVPTVTAPTVTVPTVTVPTVTVPTVTVPTVTVPTVTIPTVTVPTVTVPTIPLPPPPPPLFPR